MLNVLVLGAGGLIGRSLVDELSQHDDVRLTGFGRTPYTNIPAGSKFVEGRFEDENALKDAVKGQDIIFHLISQSIPSSTWDDPIGEVEANLTPSIKLIELAAESGVKKICFASSGGTVYGLQQSLLDEDTITEPFSPHGIIKRTIESFLQYAKVKHDLNYAIYRISNVYGEGQDIRKGLGFINTALENIINGRPIDIYGDGENVRDYIYVKDVAKLVAISALGSPDRSDIFNICSSHSASLNELVELIRKVTGVDFEVKYLPGRANDNRLVMMDNSRIMRSCDNISLTSLEGGIRKTYAFLKGRSAYVKKGI